MKNKQFNLPSFLSKAIIICIIAGLTLFVYWGIQNHQFLNFDDNVYVSANPYVKNGFSFVNIKWAFTFNNGSYWHPVTWLSFMLDGQIFGVKPGPQLLANLAIHIFNALLLFLIILKMTGAPIKAGLRCLIVCPSSSECRICRLACRKKNCFEHLILIWCDLYLPSLCGKEEKWKYALIFCLYACGLMSKPSILTFPVLLLLLDYWPLKRFERVEATNYRKHQCCF